MDAILTANADEILVLAIKLILGILSAIVTFASTRLPAKWRNEAQAAALAAEAEMRVALHKAATSGIESGIEKGLTGHALIIFAMKHIVASVPENLIGLVPSIREIVISNPAERVIEQLPTTIRVVLENIVRSKIPGQKPASTMSDTEWRAPYIPVENSLPPAR